MNDIERLASKAKQRASEYNANAEATARLKREATEFLQAAIDAVRGEDGSLAACSERIAVACTKEMLAKPVFQFRGRGIRLLGKGPQGTENVGPEEPITGEDLFLDETGTLQQVRYSGTASTLEMKWAARMTKTTPEAVIEQYGPLASRVIFSAIEGAMDRHGQGGRQKQTERQSVEAEAMKVVTDLITLLFQRRK